MFRSIDEWEWRAKPNTLSVWLYLLTHARHEAGSWQGIPLEAGQLITGAEAIGKVTGLSRQSVRTSLEHLKKTGEITIKSTNKFSLVTVVKWGLYQSSRVNTNHQTNQQLTSNQPATNQQLTTNKNEKNERMKEPPPPTPSMGEKPKKTPLFSESTETHRNDSGGGGAFDDIVLTDGNRQELSDFLSSGLTMEIVQHAVDEAAAHGQKKWSYVRGILNRYKREGITTIEQAKASDGKPYMENHADVAAREKKRRDDARTLARLRGELPDDKPKRKEKYIAIVGGEEFEYEREVVI